MNTSENMDDLIDSLCEDSTDVILDEGASEFIDVDINSIVKYGGRYIVMNLNSYTGQPFISMPECFAGFMMRSEPNSGEIYEPKTVSNKFDLTNESKVTVPLIFDAIERKVIWCDLAVRAEGSFHNLENKQTGIVAIGKALTTMSKPNLYDLFELHAKARGSIVDKEDADIIFSVDEGITPYDIETITAEYL